MSNAKRHHSEEEQAHAIQIEGLQMVLFSLEALGTKSAFLQLEMDGVMRYVAAVEMTQLEFDAFVKKTVIGIADGRASREAAAGRPL